jgi:hypothetical protein
VRARLGGALDALGLAPTTRVRVEEVFDAHFDEAVALHEKLRSGEIDGDAAHAEHDRIVGEVRDALTPFLTQEQMRRLHEALHPGS